MSVYANPSKPRNDLLVWGADGIEQNTLDQASTAARLPFVERPLALMPDAHVGIGATVGSVIATRGAIVPAAVGVDIGCVDADTEFLSPNGWRRIADWSDERVMQYHPDSGEAEFVAPLAYVKRQQAEFLHFKTKYGIDQMLTPDHRVLCWEPQNDGDVRMVRSAGDFAERHGALVLGYRARFETTFEPLIATAIPLNDDELRVQVMVMADGGLVGAKAVVHVKKQRKIDRAQKLLANAGIDYTQGTSGSAWWCRFTPPIHTKTYANMWDASAGQLRVISDECLHWDGNVADRVFYTRDRASADFIHFAFAASGYRSVMRGDARGNAVDYRVFANVNTRVAMAGTPKSEIQTVASPDGYAYCFTVPSGFLVLRRGGNVFVTGNCGMVASPTSLTSHSLPDDLTPLHSMIAEAIPAGVGRGKKIRSRAAALPANVAARDEQPVMVQNSNQLWDKTLSQFGTLGSGNHFVEVCLDQDDKVWIVLHSGSRGVGNQIAQRHIAGAKRLMKKYFIELEDPDLAYFAEHTPEFDEYIRDMLWAQAYAYGSRNAMMDAALTAVDVFLGERDGSAFWYGPYINCHHNYTEREHHHGTNLWVTRKGAIRARVGDKGIIPGSMATGTYIVEGLGNAASYESASHGAGRRMSRKKARENVTEDELREAMAGKAWNERDAKSLLDEAPAAYKPIEDVMDAQSDLVSVTHTLTQVLNYKGMG